MSVKVSLIAALLFLCKTTHFDASCYPRILLKMRTRHLIRGYPLVCWAARITLNAFDAD